MPPQLGVPSQPAGVDALAHGPALGALGRATIVLGRLLLFDALGAVLVELLVLLADLVVAVLGLAAAAGTGAVLARVL